MNKEQKKFERVIKARRSRARRIRRMKNRNIGQVLKSVQKIKINKKEDDGILGKVRKVFGLGKKKRERQKTI